MTNSVANIQRDITDVVSTKMTELKKEGLTLPKNYAYQNALKSAFFKLQETVDRSKKPALEVCTTESIANALLDMTTQGLSPAKTQCYFVVYGNKLQLTRSYFGTMAVLKRLKEVNDIWANVIYTDDVFEISVQKGREVLDNHETKFENRDQDIKGVYAIIEKADGEQILTVMTKKEIDMAWSKTKTGGGVQKQFSQEMAKRTVINRAAKGFINTSDDSDLLIQAINNTTEGEYEREDVTPHDVQTEIDTNANAETLSFDEPEDAPVEEVQTEMLPKEEVEEKPATATKSKFNDAELGF